MKGILLCVIVLSVGVANQVRSEPGWEHSRLCTFFFAEGAAAGDIDGDGNMDLVYGPQWWAGPRFDKLYRLAPGDAFVPTKGYSDNFFCFVTDANRDGHNDVLVYGFPGKEARLYLNPGKARSNPHWAVHSVASEISNESPHFTDIVPGGLPEIVCTRENSYGFYEASPDPTKPWTWRAISPKGDAGGRFEHGLGVGDVNSDGKLDIIQRMYWYENSAGDGLWKKHRWGLAPIPGGAQILVDDVDDDGDSDLITSIQAHGFGLAWFEQFKPGKFTRHDIMGQRSTDNPYGVVFSQLHALALCDVDGDGRNDFVTGKRPLAHQGKDPGGLQEPVLYWFQNTKTEAGVEFVPQFIDNDSGVGVEITVADLNADGKPDIISGNKKGLAIHIQTEKKKNDLSRVVERWRVPGGRPQDGYGSNLSPKEALSRMELPPGFSADLIASEPNITQPIAMCFDARGRIWVIEGHTYPQRAKNGEGKDRVLILEDEDGNGSFESRKVFADGLNLASGIEVGFGGVYVGAAPYLYFFPDKNQDDRPDREPDILLDGWGYQDTHETLNSFTWGPDGFLYGCQGVFTHSKVGKPGAPAEERTPLNACVWRFHPVTKKFEVYAHGTSNPWGVDFNEYGDWFVSACVIPHFYHISQGGLYQRQAGQHFRAAAFDDIKTIADHSHFAGSIRDHAFWGANKTTRPAPRADTSGLGGGHAHCGLAFYLSDRFPSHYRGTAFFHNLHGHRVVRESLERDGSGYTARHRPDFLLCNDHDFIGVGVMSGPDGALYVSDWADPQTCHHRDVEIWNRENGRIYRIRYGKEVSAKINLLGLPDNELVKMLGSGNGFIARQAQRLLQERAVAGKLDCASLASALARFENKHVDDVPLRLRALWTRHVTGLLDDDRIMSALSDRSTHVRGWAVQLSESNPAVLDKLEEMAADEESLVVRRYLASKLQRLAPKNRWVIAEHLVAHARSGNDRNIPLLCWYGIEPLVEEDSARALALSDLTSWPQLKEFLSRRGSNTPQGRESMIDSLSKLKNPDEYLRRSNQLLSALAKLPPVEQPASWAAAKKRGKDLGKERAPLLDALSRLGVRFGDPEFFPKWRGIARDEKRSPAERSRAVELLDAGSDPELGVLARELLDAPRVRRTAVTALRKHPGPETAAALIERLGEFDLQLRNQAVNQLASRRGTALSLLQAVDSKKIEASLVSPVMLDQFERFGDEKIDALIAKNWTRGEGVDLSQLQTAIAAWKKILSPSVMAKANASRGREVYNITCGTCHRLFGEGVALGPDLTGSNRADLGYVLENVLAPSSVVGNDYMLSIFSMRDGSTVSGMIREESADFYKVALPGGTVIDVKKSGVAGRKQLAQSIMPPALFDAMPLDKAADLVKYLGSPRQVPLPGEPGGNGRKGNPADAVPPPPAGVIRVEAESLAAKFQPDHGQARVQNMRHFGAGWSDNGQLWWTGGKPGAIYSLKLPDIASGSWDLTLFPTTAHDYGTAKFSVAGEIRQADFYSEKVDTGEPITFRGVTVSPDELLQIDIEITGKNPQAKAAYMVGLDRIELSPVKGAVAKTRGAETSSELIFDGKTLNGWSGNREIWRVENGAITASIADGERLQKNEFLFWEKRELADFHLSLEFQISGPPKANSGIQFRSRRDEDGHAVGYQADIDQGQRWLGCIYDEHGTRKVLALRGQEVLIAADGKRESKDLREGGDLEELLAPPGQWNRYEIIAKGSRVEIRINDRRTCIMDDRQEGEAEASGKIALQIHSGEGPVTVRFRKIELRSSR